MKAFRLHEFGGPDGLKLEELADPVAGPGEVLSACARSRSTTATS